MRRGLHAFFQTKQNYQKIILKKIVQKKKNHALGSFGEPGGCAGVSRGEEQRGPKSSEEKN
jgi:hypothetical protein